MSNIAKIASQSNVDALKKCSIVELLQFSDDEYKNIVLYSARYSSRDFFVELLIIIYENNKIAYQQLFFSQDKYGRNSLSLAAIANNVPLINYLTEPRLNYSINDRSQGNNSALSHSIKRKCVEAFICLLHQNAEFTEHELKLVNEGEPTFKKYFYSPQGFSDVICAKSTPAATYILRFVDGLDKEKQKEFTVYKDDHGGHALMAAAANGLDKIYHILFTKLTFDLLLTDNENNSLFYYLYRNRWDSQLRTLRDNLLSELKKQQTPDKIRHYADFLFTYDPELISNSTSRSNFISCIANVVTAKQAGQLSKIFPAEIERPKRSFKAERERQILRHIGSQLFFGLKSRIDGDENKLVEVQVMHLTYGGKSFLFIAANHSAVSGQILDEIRKVSLQEILEKDHSPLADPEANIRTSRYAVKFTDRVFSVDGERTVPNADSEQDKNSMQAIVAVLRANKLIELLFDQKRPDLARQMLESKLRFDQNVIFVCKITYWLSAEKFRHAEEFLTDIAVMAKQLAILEGKAVASCIGGKKRPCIGCFSRMTMDGIDRFGPRPGRFWSMTIAQQPPHAARKTVHTLLSTPSYITQAQGPNPNEYDTASDSE